MAKSFAPAALALTGLALLLAPMSAAAQKRERDRISRDEILNSAQKDQDIFQVIRHLRPNFLMTPRGVRSNSGVINPPVFYLNDTRMGDLSGLKMIAAIEVEEVVYLDPSKAENEYGITHNGGAVMVKTVKAAKLDKKPPQL